MLVGLKSSGKSRPMKFQSGTRLLWKLGFLLRPQQRKKDYVSYGWRVGYEHGETVDSHPDAPRRGHTVGERPNIVFVHLVGFFIPALALMKLLLEAAAL